MKSNQLKAPDYADALNSQSMDQTNKTDNNKNKNREKKRKM